MSATDVYCTVKVEGVEVSDLVRHIELEESDSAADAVHVTLGDSDLVLSDAIHEGLKVEIDLGRPDEHAVVFRGVVTAVNAHFPPAGGPTLRVTAADSLILLSLRPQTKRWANTSVSGIVRQIAVANQLLPGTLTPEQDTTVTDARPIQQVDETDLAFLNRLAHDYGAKLYVDHVAPTDTLHFVSTQSLLQAEPLSQTLAFNGNLSDFRVGADAWATAAKELLTTTDPQTGDTVTISRQLATASDASWTPDPARIARLGPGSRIATLVSGGAAKRARLDDYWRAPAREAGPPARAAADQSRALGDRTRRLGQSGYGRMAGAIWLRPRVRVQIDGYGGRWSGLWYLARVRHVLDLTARSYVSAFVCVR